MGQQQVKTIKCTICGWNAVTLNGKKCISTKQTGSECKGRIKQTTVSISFLKYIRSGRNNYYVSFMSRLVKASGINKSTFYARIDRGWPLEKAFYEPPVKTKTFSYYNEMISERKELNMSAVSDYFNPEVGDGSEMDYLDTEARVNALKRSFNLIYKR